MPLIIKELIIRGVVTKNPSFQQDDSIDKKTLLKYLGQMQKEIKKECIEAVLEKLETKRIR